MVDFKKLRGAPDTPRPAPKEEAPPVEGDAVDDDVQAAIDEQLANGSKAWKAKQPQAKQRAQKPGAPAKIPPLG